VRSHFNTAEMSVWDAPRRGEILFGLCVATGGRTHERAGGLRSTEVKGDDGQR
jgi:Amino acid synthesis